MREKILLENNHRENIHTDNEKLLVDKLKCAKSTIEVKQDATETVKPKNISSKTLKVDGIPKHEEIGSRTIPSNMSSKNPQHTSTSNRKESKQNISSSMSPKNPKHADTSKHGEIAKTLALSISSETSHHANTSKQRKSSKTLITKSQSLNLNKEPSDVDKQLVPYKRQFENLSHGRYIPTVLSPRLPNFSKFMSSASENGPAEEIVATKKMTIFPGGASQEEYNITRKAFYKCLWCPLGMNLDNPWCLEHRQSSEAVLGPNHNNQWGAGVSISSENVSRQNIDNGHPWGPIGGISSQSALRTNLVRPRHSGSGISAQSALRPDLDSPWYSGTGMSFESVSRPNLNNHNIQYAVSSSVLNQPLQNQVSDVRTKFECMNILS